MRVGAVSYLNTRPLVYGLSERLRQSFGSNASLQLDLPSRLADRLASGDLDVALIPTVEYFRGDHYRLVSNAAIACRGPVWSVRLLSRVDVAKIRTLALDEGSRTSQALVQILLWKLFKLRPELRPFPISVSADQIHADALLMIGDRAMHPPQGQFREIWDLGDRWCRWSERPFVFAVWAARSGVEVETISTLLDASRDEGINQFEEIAERDAGPLGLTVADCVSYFAHNLHFHLGPNELLGLELFRRCAAELSLVDVGAERVEQP